MSVFGGTFRTCRDIRLESAMRFTADIGRPIWIDEFTALKSRRSAPGGFFRYGTCAVRRS